MKSLFPVKTKTCFSLASALFFAQLPVLAVCTLNYQPCANEKALLDQAAEAEYEAAYNEALLYKIGRHLLNMESYLEKLDRALQELYEAVGNPNTPNKLGSCQITANQATGAAWDTYEQSVKDCLANASLSHALAVR